MSIRSNLNQNIKLVLFSSFVLLVSACESEQHTIQETKNENVEPKYRKEFEQWKNTQDLKLLQQYEGYFASQLKQAPTLYELTLNAHPLNKECEQYRFSLPPKDQWGNLLPALKLIEKLQETGLYANYKITSVYRSVEANTCVKGAKASKHLKNYAVDFQTLDEHMQPYTNTEEIEQKLCRFWHQEGKRHRLGLGLYGRQRFHIDTQGYRTWGIGFKSATSPCLTRPL